jgi:hypothetical protein
MEGAFRVKKLVPFEEKEPKPLSIKGGLFELGAQRDAEGQRVADFADNEVVAGQRPRNFLEEIVMLVRDVMNPAGQIPAAIGLADAEVDIAEPIARHFAVLPVIGGGVEEAAQFDVAAEIGGGFGIAEFGQRQVVLAAKGCIPFRCAGKRPAAQVAGGGDIADLDRAGGGRVGFVIGLVEDGRAEQAEIIGDLGMNIRLNAARAGLSARWRDRRLPCC